MTSIDLGSSWELVDKKHKNGFICTRCKKRIHSTYHYVIDELLYCEGCGNIEISNLKKHYRYLEYIKAFSEVEKHSPEHLKSCHLRYIGEQIAKDKLVTHKHKNSLREEYKTLMKQFHKAMV